MRRLPRGRRHACGRRAARVGGDGTSIGSATKGSATGQTVPAYSIVVVQLPAGGDGPSPSPTGGNVSFGFQGSWTGNDGNPTGFALNGGPLRGRVTAPPAGSGPPDPAAADPDGGGHRHSSTDS